MLDPKILLKHFGLFWLAFLALQAFVAVPAIRNGLAKMNAPIFTKAAQRYLPEVQFQSKVKEETGQIVFNFFSHLEVQQKSKSAKGGKVNVTTYEYVNNPRHHFNTALVFLLALFIATPLMWKKRLVLMSGGILLFYLFSVVRMSLNIREEIRKLGIGLYENDPSSFLSAHKASNLFGALGFIFIVAVFIWALLVFNKPNVQEMKRLLS